MNTRAFIPVCTSLAHSNFKGASICSSSTLRLNPLLPRPCRVRQHAPFSPSRIVMFEDIDADEDDDVEVVELRDPDSDRVIRVGVEFEFEAKGNTYFICFPVDDPVAIAYGEGGEFHEVEDRYMIQKMFPVAERALLDENIVLKNTAYWLTIDDFRDLEDESEEEEEDAEEAEDEEGEVIVEFDYRGKTYMVVRPMFPVYMIAKESEHGTTALYGEELAKIAPIAEDLYERRAEDD